MKLKKSIQVNLEDIKERLDYVICQMQNVQSRIDQLEQNSMLWMREHDHGDRGQGVCPRS